MNVSTPPSLDLACPQAKADIDKYVHMFRDRCVDKIKYRHEGIMIILKQTISLTWMDGTTCWSDCRYMTMCPFSPYFLNDETLSYA